MKVISKEVVLASVSLLFSSAGWAAEGDLVCDLKKGTLRGSSQTHVGIQLHKQGAVKRYHLIPGEGGDVRLQCVYTPTCGRRVCDLASVHVKNPGKVRCAGKHYSQDSVRFTNHYFRWGGDKKNGITVQFHWVSPSGGGSAP
jgi:hypothetical protein